MDAKFFSILLEPWSTCLKFLYWRTIKPRRCIPSPNRQRSVGSRITLSRRFNGYALSLLHHFKSVSEIFNWLTKWLNTFCLNKSHSSELNTFGITATPFNYFIQIFYSCFPVKISLHFFIFLIDSNLILIFDQNYLKFQFRSAYIEIKKCSKQ